MATPVVDYNQDDFVHLRATSLSVLAVHIAECQTIGYRTHGDIQVTYQPSCSKEGYMYHQIMRLPVKGGTEDV